MVYTVDDPSNESGRGALPTPTVQAFKVGEVVKKTHGYQFTGVIVAAFRTTKGHDRYVVESTSRGSSRGTLFIFTEGQLALDDAQNARSTVPSEVQRSGGKT